MHFIGACVLRPRNFLGLDFDFCPLFQVPSASMWTKKEIVEFKQSIQKEGGDAIIKVGHGETVTVRYVLPMDLSNVASLTLF